VSCAKETFGLGTISSWVYSEVAVVVMAQALPRKELTNAFVVAGDRVLLGMKKRGFGMGKWNGFGGKLEAGESPLQGAQRELREEAGVEMVDPQLLGRVIYSYEDMSQELLVHVFRATGCMPLEPRESEEMKPQWFSTDSIPYDKMWADDIHWYEHLLHGKSCFTARFDFAADHETIIHKEVELVENL